MHRQLRKLLLVATSLTTLSANALDIGSSKDWIDVSSKRYTVALDIANATHNKLTHETKGMMVMQTKEKESPPSFYVLTVSDKVCRDKKGDVIMSQVTSPEITKPMSVTLTGSDSDNDSFYVMTKALCILSD